MDGGDGERNEEKMKEIQKWNRKTEEEAKEGRRRKRGRSVTMNKHQKSHKHKKESRS